MSAYNNDTSPIPQNVTRLEKQLVQAPTEANGNRAVCSVTAVLANGKSFTELADADETNLAETQSSIDMAAAKALSRC